jgi:hypothetical protein
VSKRKDHLVEMGHTSTGNIAIGTSVESASEGASLESGGTVGLGSSEQ